MPGVLTDIPALWIGTALTTTLFIGLALQLPTTAPSPAAPIATTIDRVAGSPYPTTATHPVDGARIQLRPMRIAVRTGSGVSHATLEFGPVTPVPPESALGRVARGADPSMIYETTTAFQNALQSAKSRSVPWRSQVQRIIVRRVSWGEVNGTLVTA